MGASSSSRIGNPKEELAPMGRSYSHGCPSRVCYSFSFHDT